MKSAGWMSVMLWTERVNWSVDLLKRGEFESLVKMAVKGSFQHPMGQYHIFKIDEWTCKMISSHTCKDNVQTMQEGGNCWPQGQQGMWICTDYQTKKTAVSADQLARSQAKSVISSFSTIMAATLDREMLCSYCCAHEVVIQVTWLTDQGACPSGIYKSDSKVSSQGNRIKKLRIWDGTMEYFLGKTCWICIYSTRIINMECRKTLDLLTNPTPELRWAIINDHDSQQGISDQREKKRNWKKTIMLDTKSIMGLFVRQVNRSIDRWGLIDGVAANIR